MHSFFCARSGRNQCGRRECAPAGVSIRPGSGGDGAVELQPVVTRTSLWHRGFDSLLHHSAAVVNSADTSVFQTGAVGSMPTGRSSPHKLIPAEHPSRKREVLGSNPRCGSRIAGSTASAASGSSAEERPAHIGVVPGSIPGRTTVAEAEGDEAPGCDPGKSRCESGRPPHCGERRNCRYPGLRFPRVPNPGEEPDDHHPRTGNARGRRRLRRARARARRQPAATAAHGRATHGRRRVQHARLVLPRPDRRHLRPAGARAQRPQGRP